MYLLKNTTRNDFKGITVAKQQEIINQIGSPLIPQQAFDLLKQHTKNFKTPDPLAQQADKLLYELLQSQRTIKPDKGRSTSNKAIGQADIQTRANARQRRLRLLQLNLELTQKSA